jgi:hypothetical protein
MYRLEKADVSFESTTVYQSRSNDLDAIASEFCRGHREYEYCLDCEGFVNETSPLLQREEKPISEYRLEVDDCSGDIQGEQELQ